MNMQKLEQLRIQEIVDNLTLMDDDLMNRVFDGNTEATSLILKIILDRTDINVVEVVAQKELQNPLSSGRNIILDILAQDDDGTYFNVEIQQRSDGADEKRARFHSAMIDSRMLVKNQKFNEIKDSYMIFITKQDYFQCGFPLYSVNRYIKETSEMFKDGSHIIYVNGAYVGDDNIGKLMHDFRCNNPEDIFFPELAKGVKHFKEDEGEVDMCELVEEYAREIAMEYAKEIAEEKAKEIAEEKAKELTVKIASSLGASKEKIIEHLCIECSLTNEEAENAYDKFYVSKSL